MKKTIFFEILKPLKIYLIFILFLEYFVEKSKKILKYLKKPLILHVICYEIKILKNDIHF